jgi:hypothetical protein
VDEFDYRRELNVLLSDFSHRGGSEQGKQRTKPLPTSVDDVLANVFDHINIGMQLFYDERIYLGKFSLNAGSNLIYHNTSPG